LTQLAIAAAIRIIIPRNKFLPFSRSMAIIPFTR
jgi:hypothetical protein